MTLAIICLISIIVGIIFQEIGNEFDYDWLKIIGFTLSVFGIYGIFWFIFVNSEVISSLFKI